MYSRRLRARHYDEPEPYASGGHPAILETERLFMSPPGEGYALETAQLLTPEVARWLVSWPNVMTDQQAVERIRAFQNDVAVGAAFHFAVRTRERGALAGWASAWPVGDSGEWQLGYWLGETFQGRGFGLEAAKALLRHVIDTVHPPTISALIHPDNVRSMAIVRHLGMSREGSATRFVAASGREQSFQRFVRSFDR